MAEERIELFLDVYIYQDSCAWDLEVVIRDMWVNRTKKVKVCHEFYRESVNWGALARVFGWNFNDMHKPSMQMLRARARFGNAEVADDKTREVLTCSTKALLLVFLHGAAHRRSAAVKSRMTGFCIAWASKFVASNFIDADTLNQIGVDAYPHCSRVAGILCDHLRVAFSALYGHPHLSHESLVKCLVTLCGMCFGCKASARVLSELITRLAQHSDQKLRGVGFGTSEVQRPRQVVRQRRRRLGEDIRLNLTRDIVRKRKASSSRDIGRVVHGVGDQSFRRWTHEQCRQYMAATKRVADQLSGPFCLSHDATRIGNPAREYETYIWSQRGSFKAVLPIQV